MICFNFKIKPSSTLYLNISKSKSFHSPFPIHDGRRETTERQKTSLEGVLRSWKKALGSGPLEVIGGYRRQREILWVGEGGMCAGLRIGHKANSRPIQEAVRP